MANKFFLPYPELLERCEKQKFPYYLCWGNSEKSLSYSRWEEVQPDTEARMEKLCGPDALGALQKARQRFPSNKAHQWLNTYTAQTSFYEKTNQCLRGMNEEEIAQHGNEIRALRLAMLTAKDWQLRKATTLYRKIKGSQAEGMKEAFQQHKAMPFIFPGFTSTTTNAAAFENQQAVVLVLKYAPSHFIGSHADDVEDMAFPVDLKSISRFPSESEVLIPCFSSFRVLSVAENVEFNGIQRKLVVHLEHYPLNFMFPLSGLLWRDTHITSSENRRYQDDLRREFGKGRVTFTSSVEEAVNRIQQNGHDLTVVTSGSGGKVFVPRIHDLPHVRSIVVFCAQTAIHKQWSAQYTKVCGVVCSVGSVMEELRKKATPTEGQMVKVILTHVELILGAARKDLLVAIEKYKTQMIEEIDQVLAGGGGMVVHLDIFFWKGE